MAKKLMHTLQYNGYGGGPSGLEHVEVPIPIPNKDEVLLKLEAASLNPFDWKVQKGMLWPLLPRKFPHIPGTDVAGEAVEVGPEVKNFKADEKVVAMVNPLVIEMMVQHRAEVGDYSFCQLLFLVNDR